MIILAEIARIIRKLQYLLETPFHKTVTVLDTDTHGYEK